MTVWKLVVVEPAGPDRFGVNHGIPLGELTTASQVKIIWPLNDVANVSFTMDGLSPETALIEELVNDIVVYADTTPVFRGRMVSSQDTVGPLGHQIQMSAVDYRGVLGARLAPFGASFVAQDQSDAAWLTIAFAQVFDAGELGITRGAGNGGTGVFRTISFTDGSMVADVINQLGALDAGFDWEVDPLLRFNLYYPQQGNPASDVVLDYPGHVLNFTRTFDTTKFANAIYFTGASTISPVSVEGPELVGSPNPLAGTPGRVDAAFSDSTITDSTVLDLRADFQLSESDQPPVGYQMVLKSGWWTPDMLWKGDTCRLVLKSGTRINEDSMQRVTQVEVDPGDDGGETVTITTGVIPTDEGIDIQAALQRLTILELGG